MDQRALLTVLAGCPNTGKTTLFNSLTGLETLTGCWAGTTVRPAIGGYAYRGQPWLLADLPSSDSLETGPGWDSLAADLIASGLSRAILVSCSALALEQGLSYLKRLTEAERMDANPLPVVLCLTFWDEAVSQGLSIDRQLLEDVLQIPVLPFSPGSPKLLDDIREALYQVCRQSTPRPFAYGCLDFSPARLAEAAAGGKTALLPAPSFPVSGRLAAAPLFGAALTALLFGLAAAAALLFPLPVSRLLFRAADGLTQPIFALLRDIGPGGRLADCVCTALWRPLVFSLSLFIPAGAILFLLGALIKDSGLLPRAVLILDPLCRRCCLCPKAATALLTGFGSRVYGVCSCRCLTALASRRAALLSLSFIPDAGCLPLSAAAGILFFSKSPILLGLILAALTLTCLGLGLLCSLTASRAFFKSSGRPLSALALPALKRPRPLSACSFALRSCMAPALKRLLLSLLPLGTILWLAAHVPCPSLLSRSIALKSPQALSLLDFVLGLLEPIGAVLGMDGAILLSFLLSLSCNEAAAPLLFAVYLLAGDAQPPGNFWELRQFLEAQGWSQGTALCVLLFNALHWPCLSALKMARSEAGSRLHPLLFLLLPALLGGLLCAAAAWLTAFLSP